MENNNRNFIIGLVLLIIIIGGLSIWGFNRTNKDQNTTGPSVAGQTTADQTPQYFDENASVMYFYQDGCGWCIKEKDVLTPLGQEGYRVKPMNVGKTAQMWKDYQIKGTPTFIAKNGERLEGYQEKDVLKAWLDQHK